MSKIERKDMPRNEIIVHLAQIHQTLVRIAPAIEVDVRLSGDYMLAKSAQEYLQFSVGLQARALMSAIKILENIDE